MTKTKTDLDDNNNILMGVNKFQIRKYIIFTRHHSIQNYM